MMDALWNPAVDIRLLGHPKFPGWMDVSAFVPERGFIATRLDRRSPGFEAALHRGDGTGPLPPLTDVAWSDLAACGLILEAGMVPIRFDGTGLRRQGSYDDGYLSVMGVLPATEVQLIAEHVSNQLDRSGEAIKWDATAARWYLHNDPAGRVLLSTLAPVIRSMIGAPVKPSYSFISCYTGNARLAQHTDRPQCEHTLTLLIDSNNLDDEGRSSWPLCLRPDPKAQPLSLYQPLGGGVLFRGCRIPHFRPAMSPEDRHWTLLLHYVPEDFDGPLD